MIRKTANLKLCLIFTLLSQMCSSTKMQQGALSLLFSETYGVVLQFDQWYLVVIFYLICIEDNTWSQRP